MRFKKRPLIGITTGPCHVPVRGRAALREEYAMAVLEAGGAPVAVPAAGSPEEVFLSLDGILIPGGDDIAPSYYGEKERVQMKLVPAGRTDFEVALIRAAFHHDKPLLGICYGMQLINVALGGGLYQDIETDMGGRSAAECGQEKKEKKLIEHRQGFHEIIISGAGPFPRGRFMVNSSHHQGINRPAVALCPAARSEDGLIEAFYSKEHVFFAGVQWHPERMAGDPFAEGIFDSFIRAAARKWEDNTRKLEDNNGQEG